LFSPLGWVIRKRIKSLMITEEEEDQDENDSSRVSNAAVWMHDDKRCY
jgi:hypothetical protein